LSCVVSAGSKRAISFQIQPGQALDTGNLLSDEKGKVGKLHEAVKPNLAKGQWWWD
jgi:hypothetical protein